MKQKRLIYLVVEHNYENQHDDIATTVAAYGNRKRAEAFKDKLNRNVPIQDRVNIQYWLEPWELN